MNRRSTLNCLILLLPFAALLVSCIEDFNPPRIYPAYSEIVVDPGNNLTLRCNGKYPITWELPQNFKVDNVTPADGNISVSENPDEEYPFGLLLELYNLSVMDVGYYTCKFNSTETDDNDDLEAQGKAKSIYVYVPDNKRLMVPMETFIIYGTQFSSLIIPCRPSGPNVDVKLFLDEVEVIVNRPMGFLQNRTITYDKRIGFVLPELGYDDADFWYTCQFYWEGKMDETNPMQLEITSSSSIPAAKPKINDSSNGYTVVGDNIFLECFADIQDGEAFDLSWIYPNKNASKEHRIEQLTSKVHVVEYGKKKVKGKTSLLLTNVNPNDQGMYECHFSLANKRSNSDRKFIRVVEKGYSFINLSEPANLLTINVSERTPFVQWLIKVDAFPPPQITWFDNQHQEIIEGRTSKDVKKFEIKSTALETKLRINKIVLADSGVYQVLATNDNGESKTLNLTLIVRAKPVVTLASEKIRIYNTVVDELCTVTGFPLPAVEWTFRPCITNEECRSITEEKIPNSQYNTITKGATQVASWVRMTANRSGYLTCAGTNSIGSHNETTTFLVADVDYGFGVVGVSLGDAIDATEGDNVSLTCAATFYNYTDQLFWYKEPNMQLNNDSEYSIIYEKSNFSNQIILNIQNVMKRNEGKYECKAMKLNSTSEQSTDNYDIILKVTEPSAPKILDTNIQDEESVKLGQNDVQFKCTVFGRPYPLIKWYKDGLEWKLTEWSSITNRNNTSILYFQHIEEADEGKYTCEATNRIGKTSKSVNLVIKNKAALSTMYIAIIAAILLLFLILILYLFWRVRKEKRIRKELWIAGLLNFEEGQTESLNPELGIDEQAELLPYDRKWEFPREKLTLGKQLGSGAFGVVMKADAFGILDAEETTTVAVKMVKKTAEPAYIKALASELKIMVHLGKHLNVVNLLGACTKNVAKRELLVIVEYCQFGNIHNYLLRHRGVYIDQIDHNTGSIDPASGMINRAFSEGSKSSGRQPDVDYRDNIHSAITAQTTLGSGGTTVSMTPQGDDSMNECGLNSNGSVQPQWRSNYKGDYVTTRPLCTRDLLCWGFQVARGMDYLAQRKVLHGDLAARNILLADDNIVKICDFGLAKSMYKTDNYRKKGDGPLPVKWMAIESIRDRIFSTQSDVWSFGIVLWELFSLARTPYPGMQADEKLYNKLVEGYRMEKPAYANNEIYDIMIDCWRAKPVQRPSFTELEQKLGGLLEESVRSHYIDLNNPYMEMNNAWLAEKGQNNDYLAMMNAPDYGNLVSPAGRDYVNAPYGGPVTVNIQSPEETDAEGYLCMSPAKSSAIFSPHPSKNDVFDFKTPPAQRKNKAPAAPSEGNELMPMLSRDNKPARGSESDGELTSTTKFDPDFDPKSPTEAIINSADNYVNMSQQKSMLNTDKASKNPTDAFTNPSYVIMDGKNDKTGDIKNNQYNNSVYVN